MHGCANLNLFLAVFTRTCNCEKGIVSRRLAKSVEFTACTGALLCIQKILKLTLDLFSSLYLSKVC